MRMGSCLCPLLNSACELAPLVYSIMRKLALHAQVGVLIYSPTQSADHLVSRLLAAEMEEGAPSEVRLTRMDTERF